MSEIDRALLVLAAMALVLAGYWGFAA